MKYVMFETMIAGVARNIPIIFPEEMVHSIVAEAMERAFIEHGWKTCVVSAGELTVEAADVEGKSETLSVLSRGARDQAIINRVDLFHGIEP